MNICRFTGFVFILVLCFLLPSCSSNRNVTSADLQNVLETQWQTYASGKKNFGGGLAMQILSPAGDYFISTGMGAAVNNAYHFRTASVTKTFTAASIMLLAQRGKLNIDDKITDNIPGTSVPYVPDTADYAIPHKNKITIRMLLMHRAGVFDLSNQSIAENAASHGKPYVGLNYLQYGEAQDDDHQFTFDELFGIIARNKQIGFEPPALKYSYSDTGYSMLGLILQRVSGKPYGQFVRDELLVPNGLLASSLPWEGADKNLPAPFMSGYQWMNETFADVTIFNMSPFVGNGNMITTPLDLATWCKRLLTGRAGLTSTTVEMMKAGLLEKEGSTTTYGLGIIFDEKLGYGHGGAHAGYLTHMYYKPEIDTAFVIMSNVWDCATCAENSASIEAQFNMMTATANKIFTRMGF